MKFTKLFMLFLFFSVFASAECNYMEFKVLPQGNAMSLAAGSQGNFTFVLKNTALWDKKYHVYVTSTQLQVGFLETTTSTLSPGQSLPIHLQVSGLGIDYGNYSIDLSLDSDGSICDSKKLYVEITKEPSYTDEIATVAVRPEGRMTAIPGDKIRFDIEIQNNRDEQVFADLSQDNGFNSIVSFSSTQVRLLSFEKKIVTAYAEVPAGTFDGEYEITFKTRVTTPNTRKDFVSASKIIVVSQAGNVIVLNEPLGCFPVKVSQPRTMQLSLFNAGDKNEFEIGIKPVGKIAGKMLSLDRGFLNLKKGEQGYFNISINSALKGIEKGEYRFELIVQSLNTVLYKKMLCSSLRDKEDPIVLIESPEPKLAKGTGLVYSAIVFNNGTSKQNLTLSIASPDDVDAVLFKKEFELEAGEKKSFDTCVFVKQNASKTTYFPEYIASSANEKKKFNFTVLAFETKEDVQAKLEMKFKNPVLPRNAESVLAISVKNLKDEEQEVNLSISGLPKQWYLIDEPVRMLKAGETQEFKMRMTPTGIERFYPFSINAQSISDELETAKGAGLVLEEQVKKVDITTAFSKQEANGKLVAATLSISVTNKGNVVLYSLAPIMPERKDLSFSTFDDIASIAPGETKKIEVLVTPLQNTRELSLPISLKAGGKQIAFERPVKIPAFSVEEEKKTADYNLLLAAIAVIFVLALVVFLAKKRKSLRVTNILHARHGKKENA